MDWSENNVCLKCHEGGNLLICSGCPLVIHEGCMNCSAKFDGLGNFYCPHCSFKHSVAELSQARKNVKLTRKALSIFMEIESEEHVGHNNETEAVRLRQSEIGAANVSMSTGHGKNSRQEKNVILHQSVQLDDEDKIKDAEKENVNMSTGHDSKSAQKSDDIINQSLQSEEEHETSSASTDQDLEHDINGQEGQTSKENCETYDASADENGEQKISGKDKELTGEENCENSSDSTGGHLSTGHVRAKRRIVMSDSSCEKSPVRKKHGKRSDSIERTSSAVKRTNRFPRRSSSSQVTYKLSDDEFDDSSKLKRPKRPSVKLGNNVLANGKRRRVMWTEEELEMLKVGVDKYSSPTKKILPWTKILHFGRHVFHKTRTPVDLKDKWRKTM